MNNDPSARLQHLLERLPKSSAESEARARAAVIAATPSSPPQLALSGRRLRQRSRPRLIAALAVLIALVAGSAVAATLTILSIEAPAEAPPGVLAGTATDVAAGMDSVWVATAQGVARIDPATNTIIGETAPAPVSTYNFVNGLALGESTLWVAGSPSLARISLDTGRPIGNPVRIADGPLNIAVGAGAVWVAHVRDNLVTRVDPATGAPTAVIDVGPRVWGIAASATAVWITRLGPSEPDPERRGSSRFTGPGEVVRLDPATNRITARIPVGPEPLGVAVDGEGVVWVTDATEATLQRIDVAAGRVAAEVLSNVNTPTSVAVSEQAVWVAGYGSVVQIDPATGEPTGVVLRLEDGGALSLAIGPGQDLWIADAGRGVVYRVEAGGTGVVGDPVLVPGPGPPGA